MFWFYRRVVDAPFHANLFGFLIPLCNNVSRHTEKGHVVASNKQVQDLEKLVAE